MNNAISGLAHKALVIALSAACAISPTWAQQPSIESQKPTGNFFIRPYRAANIPPNYLGNSSRLHSLIRAGKLYLTAQDALALALENNIDIAFDRYNTLLDQWSVIRNEAGGALPGVPSGSSQAKSVTAGEGVAGSQAAAGVGGSSSGSTSTNAVGASITQVGTVVPTLDPVVQAGFIASHLSAPQPELVQSQVTNLISNTRIYSASISQGLVTGGNVTLSYRDQYLNENAPSDLLNPETATTLSFSLSHNLLQGFGVALNRRNITIAKANVKINDLYFQTEVIATVVNVLNLYYGLVADYEDLRAKKSALEVAQRFYLDNKKQVEIGTMAPLDVTTAEAQVASSEQDLVVSQTTLDEQQVSLKNVLSRNGLGDPLLREVQIIPLDRIVVPEKDELPPVKDMIATARAKRVDIEAEKLNIVNDETNALNTINGTMPTLRVSVSASAQGLSGAKQYFPIPPSQLGRSGAGGSGSIPPGFVPCPPGKGAPGSICLVPNDSFIGGVGTALGQMIRRDYPSQSAGGYIAPTVRNRVSIADQVIDQFGIRQAQLQNVKDTNAIAVDVSNQAIGLQQARARYQAAVHSRILEQQLLDAEQKKFSLGASTTFLVVQQQRDLATAQSAEVAALVAYSNARVALDQTLGTTLETNRITIDEAMSGRVGRPSVLPATLPGQP